METLTYRIGAHTTADDPTRYRDPAEVESWRARDPIVRFQSFLIKRDLLTADNLVDFGTLTQQIAEFLDTCVKVRRNIVISGGTGSG